MESNTPLLSPLGSRGLADDARTRPKRHQVASSVGKRASPIGSYFRPYAVATLLSALIMPGLIVFAQNASGDDAVGEPDSRIAAALEDLSAVYGQPVTRPEQARAICDLEQFVTECADIGKKHQLFEKGELDHVDAVLSELKGLVVEQMKKCNDDACLVAVANDLARTLTSTNPALARELDLTLGKVEEKKAIVEAAQEIGVSAESCRTMDPETATLELLRACAKLAQHSNVQRVLSTDARELAKRAETTLGLEEALRRGEFSCGDNTLDGCGSFCLNPSSDERGEGGTAAIPPVCREIAQQFFGPNGVQELERSWSAVNDARAFYRAKAKHVIFTTSDGRTITNPEEIGRYLEGEMSRGNVEAIERGMEFMAHKGYVGSDEREFAIEMARNVRESGRVLDFERCGANPAACADLVPAGRRAEFSAMAEIHRIMSDELRKAGVEDPASCESDPRFGESCVQAAKTALPALEAVAARAPAALPAVEEIRRHISFGDSGLDARRRAEEGFRSGGETVQIGDRTFGSFGEMESFCRTNGAICLAEAARQGFIERYYAAERYGRSYEVRYGHVTTPGDLSNSLPIIPSFRGTGPYQGFTPPGTTGTQPPGTIPGFTTAGPGFASSPSFDKREALRQFEAWLDNPIGAPPLHTMGPGDTSGVYRTYAGPQIYVNPAEYESTRASPSFCPAVAFAECPQGQYRPESRDARGCPVFGECVAVNRSLSTTPTVCPALPTVESCPSGYERVPTYSSPECGRYYKCEPRTGNVPPPPPGEYRCSIGEYWNGRVCVQSPTQECPAGQFWNGTMCTTGTYMGSCRTYASENSCQAAIDCRWYANHYDGTHCDDTAHGDASGPRNECIDGRDNDGDGTIDYPSDSGCVSRDDWTERPDGGPVQPGSCPSGYEWFVQAAGSAGYCKPSGDGAAGSCSPAISAVLGDGCHSMGNAFFDRDMTRYVLPGTTAAVQCSQTYIQYCTTGNPTTPPPGPTPTNCSIFTSQGTCIALPRCQWNAPFGFPGYCSGVYAGGPDTCPGFAHSIFDANGGRLCQLNSVVSCEPAYPNYLDIVNYTASKCPRVSPVSVPPPGGFQCGDGIDNDGDRFTDFPADTSCYAREDNDEFYPPSVGGGGGTGQCSDGVDNDGDGRTDYPSDTGCSSREDPDEGAGGGPVPSSCDSALIALLGAGCHQMYTDLSGMPIYCDGSMTRSARRGDTTTTAGCSGGSGGTTPSCRDGRDNDGDGRVDYPADPDCTSSDDWDEGPQMGGGTPQCSDGRDNDGDGQTDYPADSGCFGRDDNDEAYGSGTPPSGQREQTWNTRGLRSWVRSDASASRIESLKQACVSVASNSNVWMPGAGDSSNLDFGMPDPQKCRRASECPSGDYWDGTSCRSSGGGGGSPACSDGRDNDTDGQIDYPADTGCSSRDDWDESSTGTGGGGGSTMQRCFYPNAARDGRSVGFTVWCERDYFNCHEGSPSGASVSLTGLSLGSPSSCEAGWTGGGGSACPSGQYWNGSACIATSTPPITTAQCADGRDNDGDGQIDYPTDRGCYSRDDNDEWASTVIPPTGSCPSNIAHDMGGYCMLNNDASRCAEYPSATSEANYTTSVCTSHSGGGGGGTTAQCSDGRDNDGDGQIDYPADSGCYGRDDRDEAASGSTGGDYGTTGGCWTQATQSSCQATSGCAWYQNHYDGTHCDNSAHGTGSAGQYCPSGQYWNGTACVTSTTGTTCSSGQYWNGSACVNTSPTNCTSGQYWNGTSCVSSGTSGAYCGNHICDSGETTGSCPSDCGSYTPPSATTCSSGQYWNGTSCVSSSTGYCGNGSCESGETSSSCWSDCGSSSGGGGGYTPPSGSSCSSGQYWNGSACVTTSTTNCASGQYWNGTNCVSSTPPPSPTPTPSPTPSPSPEPTPTPTPPPPSPSPEPTPPPSPPPSSYLQPSQLCPDNHNWNGDYCEVKRQTGAHFLAVLRTFARTQFARVSDALLVNNLVNK